MQSSGLITGVLLLLVGVGLFLASMAAWAGVWVIAVVALVFLCTLFSTYYVISDCTLIIKSGFFYTQGIDISTIDQIRFSHNISSAPASSFNRIELRYEGKKKVEISPRKQAVFIQLLIGINGSIDVVGHK
jgi:hypothetical protein